MQIFTRLSYLHTVSTKRNCTLKKNYFYFKIFSLSVFKIEIKKNITKNFKIQCTRGNMNQLKPREFMLGKLN